MTEQLLADIKSVQADKHARDSDDNPQLPGGAVHKYSAAAKTQSAASDYAAAIAGDAAGAPDVLAAVDAAPRGSVDELALVGALRQQADFAARSRSVDPVVAERIGAAADKMAAARAQDVRWVLNHAGEDPRADAELKRGLA